jgi:hypothetical protein
MRSGKIRRGDGCISLRSDEDRQSGLQHTFLELEVSDAKSEISSANPNTDSKIILFETADAH